MTVGYETFGRGPEKVLALHGWFGDETSWRPMYDALSPDEFTYVAMAYRGYGASAHMAGQFSIEEIAADTLDLADRLGWESFSLMGHSMGGMAIQRVMLAAPGRVEKLVAIAPVPACGAQLDPSTYALFAAAASDLNSRRLIVDHSTGGRLTNSWITKIATAPQSAIASGAFAAYLPSWANSNFSSLVRGRPLPVSVIIGGHDAALNAEVMQATYLAWYPNAELTTLATAGHYPMNETPVALAAAVETFMRRR